MHLVAKEAVLRGIGNALFSASTCLAARESAMRLTPPDVVNACKLAAAASTEKDGFVGRAGDGALFKVVGIERRAEGAQFGGESPGNGDGLAIPALPWPIGNGVVSIRTASGIAFHRAPAGRSRRVPQARRSRSRPAIPVARTSVRRGRTCQGRWPANESAVQRGRGCRPAGGRG